MINIKRRDPSLGGENEPLSMANYNTEQKKFRSKRTVDLQYQAYNF